MHIFKTLRFRLAFLFGVSLTALSFLVLIILLNDTKKQLLEEIDSLMIDHNHSLESYAEEFNHREHHINYEKITSRLEAESFELLKHGSLQNEAYILSYKTEESIYNVTFSDTLHKLDLNQLKPLIGENELGTVNIDSLDFPIRYHRSEIIDDHQLIIIASLENYQKQISQMRVSFLAAAFAFILIGSLIAWMTLRKSMKGVLLVTEAADRFADGDLQQRVSWQGKGSEINNLVNHFNHMTTQTEKLIHEMNEVTNNIAHDLRTPVTRMRGLAENILEKDSDNKLGMQVIEECERQAVIIEDILNLAESEAGALSLNLASVNINQLIEDITDIYQPLIEASHCQLKSKLPANIITANIDQNRLQRVIANLLDNALKYSQGAEIQIALIEKPEFFTIQIRDFGPGISSQEKLKIFKRFFRGDKSRNSQGSGLGLSLAKSYIENLGGSLELENTSKGASFLITLSKS